MMDSCAYQKASLNHFQQLVLHVIANKKGFADLSQPIADRSCLLEVTAPAHSILLQSLKLPIACWYHTVQLSLLQTSRHIGLSTCCLILHAGMSVLMQWSGHRQQQFKCSANACRAHGVRGNIVLTETIVYTQNRQVC